MGDIDDMVQILFGPGGYATLLTYGKHGRPAETVDLTPDLASVGIRIPRSTCPRLRPAASSHAISGKTDEPSGSAVEEKSPRPRSSGQSPVGSRRAPTATSTTSFERRRAAMPPSSVTTAKICWQQQACLAANAPRS